MNENAYVENWKCSGLKVSSWLLPWISQNDCFHWNGLEKRTTETHIFEWRKDEHWTMRIQKHQTKVKMYGNVHEYLNTKWTRLYTLNKTEKEKKRRHNQIQRQKKRNVTNDKKSSFSIISSFLKKKRKKTWFEYQNWKR